MLKANKLLYYGYLHMIEFSYSDNFHSSHSVKIQERRVYTHMVIIIEKVHNNLIINVYLGYGVGPHGYQGIIHVFWYPPAVNWDKLRQPHLKEFRISLVFNVRVNYQFTILLQGMK